MQNLGAVVTRTMLAERIWGSVYVTDDVLNTTVATLRRKLNEMLQEAGEESVRLETERGVGYRLSVQPD
jgi:DNA-binding response OmpR family regulator